MGALKFEVVITETYTKTVTVTADDYDDAYEKVDQYVSECKKGFDPTNDRDASYHRDLDVNCLCE